MILDFIGVYLPLVVLVVTLVIIAFLVWRYAKAKEIDHQTKVKDLQAKEITLQQDYENRFRQLTPENQEAVTKLKDVGRRMGNMALLDMLYFRVMFIGPMQCGKTWIWQTWSEPWLGDPSSRRTNPNQYPRATVSVLNTWEMFRDADSLPPDNPRDQDKLGMGRKVMDPNLGIVRPYGVQICAELYDSAGEIGERTGNELSEQLRLHVEASQRLTTTVFDAINDPAKGPIGGRYRSKVFLLFFFDFVGNVKDLAAIGPRPIAEENRTPARLDFVPDEGKEINERYYSSEFCETLRTLLDKQTPEVDIIGAEIVFSQADRMTDSLKANNGLELRKANEKAIRNIQNTFMVDSNAVRVVSARTNENVNRLYKDVASRGIFELLSSFEIRHTVMDSMPKRFTPPLAISRIHARTCIKLGARADETAELSSD